jgi:hypothetical protein
MVTLILEGLAGAFVLAGLYLLARRFTRRPGAERRRLSSLGTVDAHREARRDAD